MKNGIKWTNMCPIGTAEGEKRKSRDKSQRHSDGDFFSDPMKITNPQV